MGVKDLWTVLEPAAERCHMADLRGKTLAIDVSGWIYQSHGAKALAGKESLKPHLRNLFLRVFFLMRNQVRVVAVFDGVAPLLKQDTLRRRQEARNGPGGSPPMSMSPGHSKFKQMCDECKEMLTALGVPYIDSAGEAEATCAVLNQQKVIDGVITEDSDALLFGATVVYRNFTGDATKVNDSLKQYRLAHIEATLGLNQDKLVALALLLGCDYAPAGVKGIGKEHAMKLIKSWTSDNVLDKLRQWRRDKEMSELGAFEKTSKPPHCQECGHLGVKTGHQLSGCTACSMMRGCIRKRGQQCTCTWHSTHSLYDSRKEEVKMWTAAMVDPNFPSENVIAAYLHPTVPLQSTAFKWERPAYKKLEKYLLKTFGWDSTKARDKLIQYYTALDMYAVYSEPCSSVCQASSHSMPDRVLSRKQEKGRQMYTVKWKSIPDVPTDAQFEHVTTEYKDVFSAAFPQVAAQYEGWLSTSPKGRKRKTSECETPMSKQPRIDQFYHAKKRLNFDGMASNSPLEEDELEMMPLI